MLCFPNCKINLGLYVTGRRDDGYHNIETVFYPLPCSDALEIVPATPGQIHLYGKAVAGDPKDNLVTKAFDLLRQQFGNRVPELDIHLLKAIPMGAGLGGGSADAAFMLKMLNDHCELALSQEELAGLALKLGSDCPFFIYNTPQFAKGRGEEMQPVSVNLEGYSIHVICPGLHVSTAAAFRLIRPQPAAFDLRSLGNLAVTDWKDHITNDFEAPVFQLHPQLADLKEHLYRQGAIYASMSGSGSAIFGIFRKGEKASFKNDVETFYI